MNKKKGFIVHPFETSDNKYNASYGNHNKTVRSFKTLREAKTYLKNKGVSSAGYDSPAGYKDISTIRSQQTKRKKPKTKSNNFLRFNI